MNVYLMKWRNPFDSLGQFYEPIPGNLRCSVIIFFHRLKGTDWVVIFDYDIKNATSGVDYS